MWSCAAALTAACAALILFAAHPIPAAPANPAPRRVGKPIRTAAAAAPAKVRVNGPSAAALSVGPAWATPGIAVRGHSLALHATVSNQGKVALRDVLVRFETHLGPGPAVRLPDAPVGTLGPGASAVATASLKPSRNGDLRVTATAHVGMAAAPAGAVTVVPVLERPVTFAWFGVPEGLRWANMSTTAGAGQASELLRRGIFPLQWKGGVCYKEWDLSRFVDSWCDAERGIAIDEFGGEAVLRAKLIEATRQARARRPDLRIAWWGIGSFSVEDYTALKEYTDLFLPEIYLNYRSFHLGAIEKAIRIAREAGVLDKTLIALGINDREHKAPFDPTPEEIRAQFEQIRRLAPEMPGIAFFNFAGAQPAIRELCDRLCHEYFLDPVLTLAEPPVPVVTPRGPAIRVTLRNLGFRDAPPASVRLFSTETGRVLSRAEAPPAPAGKSVTVDLPLPALSAPTTLRAEIDALPDVTLLDPAAEVAVAPPDAGEVLALPASSLAARVVCHAPPADALPGAALDAAPVGAPQGAPRTAAQLDPEWSLAGPAAVWAHRGAGAPAYYRLSVGAQRAPSLETRTGRWEIATPHYQAVLDLDHDALVEIHPAGNERNLLQTPWEFRAPGVGGYAPATVTAGPVFVKVRVPFSTAEAEGFSDYAFFLEMPAIRIRREYRPRRPIQVESTKEGASFAQKGGTFQCRAGVGGGVQRGALADGQEYRDLLFGYTGSSPEPENHDRTGWFDFSWRPEEDAGLGVAVEKRWRAAASGIYDLTRYYDASDWIDIPMVCRTKVTVKEPQESIVWLFPHAYRDLSAATPSPVGEFLDSLRARAPKPAIPLSP